MTRNYRADEWKWARLRLTEVGGELAGLLPGAMIDLHIAQGGPELTLRAEVSSVKPHTVEDVSYCLGELGVGPVTWPEASTPEQVV